MNKFIGLSFLLLSCLSVCSCKETKERIGFERTCELIQNYGFENIGQVYKYNFKSITNDSDYKGEYVVRTGLDEFYITNSEGKEVPGSNIWVTFRNDNEELNLSFESVTIYMSISYSNQNIKDILNRYTYGGKLDYYSYSSETTIKDIVNVDIENNHNNSDAMKLMCLKRIGLTLDVFGSFLSNIGTSLYEMGFLNLK